MATDRIVVHSSIAQKFAEALKESLAQFGKGATPILITSSAAARVKRLVDDAVEQGAKPLCRISSTETKGSEFRLDAVVLESVTKDMELYYEESFGPVVALYTFNTDEEALAIANDTEYGLAGAVFTKDLARGIRLAKNYITGAVHINSMTIHDEAALPHGGHKSSGFGRFGAGLGLSEFLRTKTITWED
jgi:acyl-CoA reductase-like NAD-dependent aldehyde dehydrogenase